MLEVWFQEISEADLVSTAAFRPCHHGICDERRGVAPTAVLDFDAPGAVGASKHGKNHGKTVENHFRALREFNKYISIIMN